MKRISFIVLLVSLFYYGCVDAITPPTDITGDTQNPTITIKYPHTNDTLQLGSNEFLFDAKGGNIGVRAVELWVDSTFKALVNYNGTTATPSILWTIDSTYLGKTIKYFLRVFDKDGKSTDSPTQTNIFVAKVNAPPKAPTNLAVLKVSESNVNLSWQHDYQHADGFRIYKKTGLMGIYTKLKDVTANSTNYNDVGLDPAIVYFYQLVAFNIKGESLPSNEVLFSGNATLGTIAAPTNLVAVAFGGRKILLTWNDNSYNENLFKIERKTTSSEYQLIGIAAANVTTFKDSGLGLVPNTEYYYRIKAVSDNDSVNSAPVNTVTYPYDLLAPFNLRATSHNSKTIRLVWTDNNTSETITFIERRDASSSNFKIIGSVGSNVSLFDDHLDIQLGKTYYYRIRVFDDYFYSEYTNEVFVTVQSQLIIAPTNLQVVFANGNTMKLTWNDNSNNETNFIIERADDVALTNFAEIFITGENSIQYEDKTTTGGKTYAYRIRATDGVVFSGYSNAITIKNPSSK